MIDWLKKTDKWEIMTLLLNDLNVYVCMYVLAQLYNTEIDLLKCRLQILLYFY